MKPQIQLRIIVVDPPAGVTFAVQRGQSAWLPPVECTPSRWVFEFPVILADLHAEPPRFTGEFTQGPAQKRFVYVNSGTLAGQYGSCWTRRAKVPLYGISVADLQQVLDKNGVLEATVSGRSKDGGPACATVPLLAEWAPT